MTPRERESLQLLIGAATVRLRTDESLTERDREGLLNLVGISAARLAETRLTDRLGSLEKRIAMLERRSLS
jgi:hypothetical protein